MIGLNSMTSNDLWLEHRIMWIWLADHPNSSKEEYPPFAKELLEVPHAECFLCELALRRVPKGLRTSFLCQYCPADWSPLAICHHGYPYEGWAESESLREAARCAMQIANIPRKGGIR